MNTLVEVIVYPTEGGEKEYHFSIPHLPIEVGQQLTLGINVNGNKWTINEETTTVEVEGIDFYIRDSYSDSGRAILSVQTLYCKEV